MQMTIIISYRPSREGMDSPAGPIFQDAECRWQDAQGIVYRRPDHYGDQDDIYRAVESIKKNSIYNHQILIAIDNDMTPHENWLKKLGENVQWIKSGYDVPIGCPDVPQKRGMNALRAGILYCEDDDIVCYAFPSDAIAGKNWDKYVVEAMQKFGDEKVYTPIFVEARTDFGCNTNAIGEKMKQYIDPMGDLTPDNIWNKWRDKYCCHSLTLKPPTDRDYFNESDLDEWSEVARKGKTEVSFEPCGSRDFGYYAVMIARNKIFKKAADQLLKGSGGDTSFDNNLGCEKAVVTASHVFHIHTEVRLDDKIVVKEEDLTKKGE